jgi:serine/threonine-protein kinase
VKGKWAYMAPEQARGLKVDRRADVWALGVCAWEVLTGQRLFARTTPTETVLAVTGEDIPAPSSVEPAVPRDLDRVVMRALSRRIDERTPTARQLGRELAAFLSAEGEPTGPLEIAEWLESSCPEAKERAGRVMRAARSTLESIPPALAATLKAAYETAERERKRERSMATAASPLRGRRSITEPEPAEEVSSIDVVLGDGPERESAMPTAPRARTPAASAAPAARARSPRGTTVGVALAAVVLVVVGGLAWARPIGGSPASDAPTIASAPPAAGEPSPAVTLAPREAEPPAETAPAEPAPPAAEASDVEPAAIVLPAEGTGRAAPVRSGPADRPEGSGSLTLVTRGGWGTVYRRGRALGETPLRTELPAGRHVLEVRPFGQPPGRRVTVVIRAGEQTTTQVSIDE